MFMIKGRKYNVEYEGLHLLCKTCGRFGHYSEGCKEKTVAETVHQEDGRTAGGHKAGSDLTSKSLDGPWMVVQKQKRNKRVKDKESMVPATMEGGGGKSPVNINAAGNINGSWFAALMSEPEQELQTNYSMFQRQRLMSQQWRDMWRIGERAAVESISKLMAQ
jgi:hypothetical protein